MPRFGSNGYGTELWIRTTEGKCQTDLEKMDKTENGCYLERGGGGMLANSQSRGRMEESFVEMARYM
jgi:hypothetical protein